MVINFVHYILHNNSESKKKYSHIIIIFQSINNNNNNMTTKKPTKAQLLQHLQQIAIADNQMMSRTTARILREAVDYKDLKEVLKHKANKFYSIRKQGTDKVQWYGGERFYYTNEVVEDVLYSIHWIAEKMNYELYSPNGFWFIK